MKSVLISIQPKWCELISSGKKTIEIRKTRPNIETPFKCYIYCTKGRDTLWRGKDRCYVSDYWEKEKDIGCVGRVIGEFVCDDIFPIRVFENGSIQDYLFKNMCRSCVPYDDISEYIGNENTGYGWHISDLVIYDEPRKLSEFCGANKRKTLTRPPQSWCYVEELR